MPHKPNHKTDNLFPMLGEPLTPKKEVSQIPENFVAAPQPLTVGDRFVNLIGGSKHPDAERAKGHDRGLKNTINFLTPQSKGDIALELGLSLVPGSKFLTSSVRKNAISHIKKTLLNLNPSIRKSVKMGVDEYGVPTNKILVYQNVGKKWEDAADLSSNTNPIMDDFLEGDFNPSLDVDDSGIPTNAPGIISYFKTGKQKLARDVDGKIIKPIPGYSTEDGYIEKQIKEVIQSWGKGDRRVLANLELAGLYDEQKRTWNPAIPLSKMSYVIRKAQESELKDLTLLDGTKPKNVKVISDLVTNYLGLKIENASRNDHGKILRFMFKRFKDPWVIGNYKGHNSFTTESLYAMLNSVLRKGAEIEFFKDSGVYAGRVPYVPNYRKDRTGWLTENNYQNITKEIANSYQNNPGQSEEIIRRHAQRLAEMLWRSGKVKGAKTLDDVKEISGLGVKKNASNTSIKRLASNSFQIRSFKTMVAGILGVPVYKLNSTLKELYPEEDEK